MELSHTQLLDESTEDVECFLEDEELMVYYGNCEKNPGHRNYTRMSDLCLDTLPNRIKDRNVLKTIQLCSTLVVRVVVNCVSPLRPKGDPFYHLIGTNVRRTASGYVRSVIAPDKCNIPNCQDCWLGKHNKYGEIDIVTNKHVVYDDSEAAGTTS